MDALLHDLRHALRQLRQHPGFTAVAVVTLALGIGTNSAVFSAVYSLLFNPLPFVDGDRVVAVWEVAPQGRNDHNEFSAANLRDVQATARSFERLVAHAWWAANLTGGDEPEREVGNRAEEPGEHRAGESAEYGSPRGPPYPSSGLASAPLLSPSSRPHRSTRLPCGRSICRRLLTIRSHANHAARAAGPSSPGLSPGGETAAVRDRGNGLDNCGFFLCGPGPVDLTPRFLPPGRDMHAPFAGASVAPSYSLACFPPFWSARPGYPLQE